MSGNRNIADEAARARKILAKNAPANLSATTGRAVALAAAPQNLGPYAVVVVAGPTGAKQFTLHRPIGITDLAKDDWCVTLTDQVGPTLARAGDPRQGEINQLRAQKRAELAVTAGKLLMEEIDGVKTYFYPNKVGVESRNSLLGRAQADLKNEKSLLERGLAELEELKDLTAQEYGNRKGAALNRIRALRPLDFLKEEVRAAEVALQVFWDLPATRAAVEAAHPQTYRTMAGTHGDTPQRAIPGASGLSMQEVIDKIGAAIAAIEIAPAPEVAQGAPTGTRPTLRDRLTGRGTTRSPSSKGATGTGATTSPSKKD